jgi:predicted ATPase
LVRFDPDALRRESQLIPLGHPLVLSERGDGLPGVYDAMRDRSVERFASVSSRLRELFPTVKELRLRAISQSQKVLAIELMDGTEVRADAMSEGLLYFLAFAALREVDPPSIFLVEEPENGLHPARIADVVSILRDIAEDKTRPVQVLMATHSPLVINELAPSEVSVVTRDEGGTHITPIAETPNFAERSKVFNLGELWLSYADGRVEAPLLKGVDADADRG